jgi:hypothetical protein
MLLKLQILPTTRAAESKYTKVEIHYILLVTLVHLTFVCHFSMSVALL